jgi:glycosyltransferase involved in cell wall biosynthesis
MIEGIKPDLVHAMRIPFEGMLAAEALRKAKMPLLLSVWGNDFTLFAEGYPLVALLTRRALTRADALHTDCHRDLRLAHRWGFDVARSEIVLPGSGGVQGQVFRPGPANAAHRAVPQGAPVILNSRGFRGYVRNDTFFRSIPLVLEQRPEAVFFGVAMQGNPIAERWVRELGIASAVRLLPAVRRPEMAELFRLADVTVSPSEHDGTPNTLLEAMACGCFPVAGDIESVREWIEDGVNGLLCDPASPESLAQAILRALNDSDLRQRARQHNVELIAERAEYGSVMAQAEQFYRRIVEFASSERRQG